MRTLEFRIKGFGLLIAVGLAGCATLNHADVEGCRIGKFANFSDCERYRIVERDGEFVITKDWRIETAAHFKTLEAAEEEFVYINYCDREGSRKEPRIWGCSRQPSWLPISPAVLSALGPPPSPPSTPAPSGYVPLIDPAIITDRDRFDRDLAQCQDLASANTVRDQALTTGVEGAAAGAAMGALVGLAVGAKPGHVAPFGALSGGVGGLGAGAVNQEAT